MASQACSNTQGQPKFVGIGHVGHVDHGELNLALNLDRHATTSAAANEPLLHTQELTLALILGGRWAKWP